MLFSTRIKPMRRVLACACMIAPIKYRRQSQRQLQQNPSKLDKKQILALKQKMICIKSFRVLIWFTILKISDIITKNIIKNKKRAWPWLRVYLLKVDIQLHKLKKKTRLTMIPIQVTQTNSYNRNLIF